MNSFQFVRFMRFEKIAIFQSIVCAAVAPPIKRLTRCRVHTVNAHLYVGYLEAAEVVGLLVLLHDHLDPGGLHQHLLPVVPGQARHGVA